MANQAAVRDDPKPIEPLAATERILARTDRLRISETPLMNGMNLPSSSRRTAPTREIELEEGVTADVGK